MRFAASITSRPAGASEPVPPPPIPCLSVVLPTDAVETVSQVLDGFAAQPGAATIEIVLVVPPGTEVSKVTAEARRFAGIAVVEVASLSPLGAARAAGIRAARAPLVFLGETHSYPQAGWMQALQEAKAVGDWDAIACGMINANPETRLSWAAFLADYGRWSATLPAGTIDEAPLHNSLYRRDVLLALGAGLDGLMSHGDGLKLALRARGHRARLVPTMRLAHLNIDQVTSALRERLLAGILIGVQRAGRWPKWRRLGYAVAAPLIAVVLCRRMRPGFRSAFRAGGVPRGTFPLACALQGIRAWGELRGYLGLGPASAQAEMDQLEIRKTDYCVRRTS